MDFFGGIGRTIGNFFSSVFGGNDEEEKKRRQQQQAAQRAQQTKPAQQRPQTSNFSIQSQTDLFKAPNAQPTKQIVEDAAKKRQLLDQIIKTGKPTGTVMLNQPKLSPKEVAGALQERAKQQVYKKEGGTPYERAVEEVPFSLQKMAQDIVRIPETVVRSGAQLLDKATTGVDQDYSQKEDNSGLRRFLYGKEPVKTYQKQGTETEAAVKGATGIDLPAPLLAVALTALDTTGLGVKQAIENVVKGGADIAIRAVRDRAEKDLGRRLTEKEAEDIAAKTRDALEKEAAKEPTKPEQKTDTPPAQPSEKAGSPAPTEVPSDKPVDVNTPTREDVGKSYADTYNAISSDKNLTPQQKVDFLAEAKSRHIELLKQVDAGEQAQKQTVDEATKANAATQQAQQEAVAQTQADQAAQVAPPPEAVVQTAPAETPTDVTQNATYGSDEAFRQGQDDRQKALTENPVKQLFDTVKRNVYDPRQVQAKLDKQELKRLKEAGLIKPGQTELLPEQSLAVAQGKIENPYRAADVRNKTKYTTGGKPVNLEDIIKFYGKDDSPKARAFENYRIYKDELERQAMGAEPSIPVDPRAMAEYVTQYEAANPRAIDDNAALRAMSLDALKAKNEARIDAPDLLANSEKFRFYNPREATDPEELVRAKVAGGVRSGAKQTQLRSDTAGGVVRSPLSLFLKRNVETERALATQQRDTLIRQKAQQGVPGFNEVVNADTVIQHKQALQTMRDLGDTLKDLQVLKKGTRREAKQQGVVDKAKADAITLVRNYLREQAADPKAVKFADKIKDKEALDLFNVITEAGEVNGKRLTNKIAKDSGIPSDQIKEFITGVQQEIKDTRSAKTDAFNEFTDTTQNLERGTQTINYKLDGEVGKVEIPIDLAKELSAANEALSNSPLEKVLQAVSGVQKATWTGTLAPVFKVINALVKNPLLAYRNAEGLSGVSPQAVAGSIGSLFRTPNMRAFTDEMLKRGAAYENALQTKNIMSTTADEIAARAGIVEFFSRNPASSFGDLIKGLNQGFAALDNAQRTGVAYGAYRRARALGYTEQEALDIGSQAPARVFGDFDRVSRLAQNAEIILPYSGAIQAGTRALVKATTQRPVETIVKDATFLATAAGLTAYSLSNSNQYYQDMIDAGKEYELDGNFTVVLPGAHKDEKGNWTGVVTIPLVPDLQPYNRAVWRSVYNEANGKDLDPAMIAGELFNQFTGDVARNVYDPTRTNDGKNPLNGVLPGAPIGNTLKITSGVNPRTGEPLSDEYLSRLPREQQATDYTSDAAKQLSQMLGGTLTPVQVDQFLSQAGSAGRVVQNRQEGDKEPTALDAIGNLFDVTKPFEPGKSMSDKQASSKQYFKDLDVVKGTITDEKTFKAFEAAHSKGDPNAPKNILNSATKANQYMQYSDGAFTTTPLFEAERKLDALQRAQGKPGNPIFDLAPQELQKVLNYRSSKIANAAKQNYTKNGEGMFQALGLDNKWYSDFLKKESAYYKAVIPDSGDDSEILTFSGKKKPAASPELQKVEDTYYSLPEKSSERRAYLAAHPELKSYWAEENDFTDEERKALGFDEIPDYKSGKGGYGYGGGSSTWNALNPILNLGDNVQSLDVGTRKEIEDLMPALRRLFAPHKGGKATVKLGAQSSGNPRG